ncbi:ABC transporter substrate-binding protein [Chachezhania sediminis]|uniref:ABC transporter substrate-binding protein n=1 Tax=Chachezhania sediminis TaxID=2599291 RepID=UPI00131D1C26|nr:ABC transporter substrate-binding protein [Chachezhania sediminis]
MSFSISRLARQALLAAGLVGACTAAHAQDTFRIAGLVPLSGAFGILGENMRRGATIAIEERGGEVLGVPIEVVWDDTETSTQVAIQKATKAMARGVDMIFGEASSTTTLAIMKLAEQRKVPHIVTLSADDRITGADKSRYTFRTSNNVAMEVAALLAFAKNQNLEKMYIVMADYSVGRDLAKILETELPKNGIEVVGTEFVPIGTSDYAIILNKALESGADGLSLVVVGADVATSLKQGADVGLGEKMTVMGLMLMDETQGMVVGERGSVGINSTLRYHHTQDSDRNRDFVAAFVEKYGELPNQYAGEAYDGMSWWLDTVDATGVFDKEAWIDAFEGSVRDSSVEGLKVMRACDHQAEQVALFGTAVPDPSGELPIVMEIAESFEAEELFAPCE